MWGTIARLRMKPGSEEFLLAQMRAMSTDRMAGWRETRVFRSATDPHEFWMVALFEDEAAYRRNAESPSQHQVYLMIRAQLESDIEWHDVELWSELLPD
jgi:heme-degrading monooxygenase HmoA